MSVFLRLNKHQRQRFANILSPLIYCAEKIICRTGTLQGEIFFSLARKYERSGQFDIAISLMDIALLRLPSQPEVHDYRMKLLQEHYAHRVEWNENTFAEVKSFCGFLGYPRSGHSLVGSIVDAHPNAAIAHEADIFSRFSGPGNETISRLSAFGALYENASVYGRFGREWQGHKYFVDGQYQGRSGSIKVIGDKKGDAVVAQYDRDPGIIKRAREVFQVPMKFIHVVRNPFDNIARIALRDNRSLDWSVDFYFDKVDIVQRIHQNEDLDILTRKSVV